VKKRRNRIPPSIRHEADKKEWRVESYSTAKHKTGEEDEEGKEKREVGEEDHRDEEELLGVGHGPFALHPRQGVIHISCPTGNVNLKFRLRRNFLRMQAWERRAPARLYNSPVRGLAFPGGETQGSDYPRGAGALGVLLV
jgi:hypothetical protein